MSNRKLIYSIIFFFAILAVILAIVISYGSKNNLEVVFLDVGQGDAALISQGSHQMLIDGGKDGKLLLEKLGRHVPFWDRSIEAVIITHPDQDHIGGLIDLLKAYKVKSVIKTNSKSDSETYKKLEEGILSGGVEEIEAKKNLTITFPNGAVLKAMHPPDSLPEEADNTSNDNSVVVKLIFGENSFLFTGDLPGAKEEDLINAGEELGAKILKISHHGSKYSTSDEFLESVKPEDAIISVGRGNSYGHPSGEVLERLLGRKARILRTDELGDIIYSCRNAESRCMIAN